VAVPLSGSSKVVSIRKREVLPAPSGPIKPNSSPFFTEKDTSRNAGMVSLPFLYDFDMLFIFIMFQ
jgi:hypothetical protein